jgi:hypothetical protein
MSEPDRQRIIRAAAVTARKTGRTLSQTEFTHSTGITSEQIARAFPDHGWTDVARAADLEIAHPVVSALYTSSVSAIQLLVMLVVTFLAFVPLDRRGFGMWLLFWTWLRDRHFPEWFAAGLPALCAAAILTMVGHVVGIALGFKAREGVKSD